MGRSDGVSDAGGGLRAGGAPFLLITHGVSGSGKSTVAAQVCATVGAIRLRSDVIRKALFGLQPEQRSDGTIYTAEANERTFTRLRELARQVIGSGHSVLVDATFLKRRDRSPFVELAGQLGVRLAILDCHAPVDELRRRVRRRAQEGRDVSEAGLDVLGRQLAQCEPLSVDEGQILSIDTRHALDLPALRAALH